MYKIKKGDIAMDVNLVKALLYIGKTCAFAPFCGKLPNEW